MKYQDSKDYSKLMRNTLHKDNQVLQGTAIQMINQIKQNALKDKLQSATCASKMLITS